MRRDLDFWRWKASEIFSVDYKEVTEEMKKEAKRKYVNSGAIIESK